MYELGDSIKVRRRVYTYVSTEPHTTKAGRKIELIVWKSKCKDCKAVFEIKAVKITTQAHVNTRCEPCRKIAMKPFRQARQAYMIRKYYRENRSA